MQEAGGIESETVLEKELPKKEKGIPTVADVVNQEVANGNVVEPDETAVRRIQNVTLAQDITEQSQEPKEEMKHYEDTKTFALFEAENTEQEYTNTLYDDMNLESETALLETVLFLESEPQTVEVLSKITQLSEDVVRECLERLKDKYQNVDSGIELAQIIGGWTLVPKKECFDIVKERYGKKNEGRLSKAAIETLSIIAYSQPITRAEIETYRHVNADNMMRVLLDRKFIKEVGKKDVPGKPIMYGTTKEFLEFFHLQSIADLPQLDEKESERFELAR